MTDTPKLEPMLEMYICETNQLIDRLEQLIMESELSGDLSKDMEEIFRIMHTIKGNSMMMMFEGIAELAHIMEDVFDLLRKSDKLQPDYEKITDLVLDEIDYIKSSTHELEAGGNPLEKPEDLIIEIKEYLNSLTFMNADEAENILEDKDQSQKNEQKYYIAPAKGVEKTTSKPTESDRAYEVVFRFSEGCEMENIRAFSTIHGLKELAHEILHLPADIVEDDSAAERIKENGFQVLLRTVSEDAAIRSYFDTVAFVEDLRIKELTQQEYNTTLGKYIGVDIPDLSYETEVEEVATDQMTQTQESESVTVSETDDASEKNMDIAKSTSKPEVKKASRASESISHTQSHINVGISKVDKLMDLVGELVVSESMVTRNPDLRDVQLENFDKAVRQHRIIINELQDIVMSIRMMPLSVTFQKMNRLVRDMKKKVGKDIDFEIRGQETEVDKNVIEQIGDPLMHLIRNSIDHGIENSQDRMKYGKKEKAQIILEAKHSGGEVWITVKDDGQGIDTERILDKAESKGLLMKAREEYSDREIYNFLFHSGFSTKEKVTEFSGRGVGLDVVAKNVEALGGTIMVDSSLGKGTEFAIRIPLTLAIIDGMMMSVDKSIFVLPITAIKESFSAKDHDVIVDPDGHEMCMIRGACYPILRLHNRFELKTSCTDIDEGILIMTEYDGGVTLLFADAILGEQQVVVKSLSSFLQKVDGISGCALLGDGQISLILDPAGLVKA